MNLSDRPPLSSLIRARVEPGEHGWSRSVLYRKAGDERQLYLRSCINLQRVVRRTVLRLKQAKPAMLTVLRRW